MQNREGRAAQFFGFSLLPFYIFLLKKSSGRKPEEVLPGTEKVFGKISKPSCPFLESKTIFAPAFEERQIGIKIEKQDVKTAQAELAQR